MAHPPRRTPTVQELAERVSRLEKQMTEMVKTLANSNTSAAHEMNEIRRALLDGRDELRRAFADTATRELVIRLRDELQGEIRAKHTEVMTQFEKLQIRNDKERQRDKGA
jgi:hypothetical protein